MSEIQGPGVVKSSDIILGGLNTKLSVGGSLTQLEILMGMTAEATQTARTYGPGPRDSQPIEMPLPESLKGAIASAKG